MKISFKVDVKRKFKINGKEYGSLEEMPPEARRIFETAFGSFPALPGEPKLEVEEEPIPVQATEIKDVPQEYDTKALGNGGDASRAIWTPWQKRIAALFFSSHMILSLLLLLSKLKHSAAIFVVMPGMFALSPLIHAFSSECQALPKLLVVLLGITCVVLGSLFWTAVILFAFYIRNAARRDDFVRLGGS